MGKLTVQDLDLMKNEDEWLGYGYLGERDNVHYGVQSGERKATDAARMDAVDQMVIAHANANGFTYEELFTWANHANGRHFVDRMLGWSDDIQFAWVEASRWNLEPVKNIIEFQRRSTRRRFRR